MMTTPPPLKLPPFEGDVDRWLRDLTVWARHHLGLRAELTVSKALEALKRHPRVSAWKE
jgi:hypothetical protein